ncbi:MAG: colicin import rane protein [Massilia sp.]|jgi:colicin import membrane protein
MKPATNGSPYTVPPEPNRVPAILLALAVHAALLAFLWIGVSWQNTEPVSVEAEVWDMKVESAATPPPPPPPQEVVEPEPRPEPTPVPPPPAPKVAEPEPVKPAPPDINLEREKKLAEQKKQREFEQKKQRELEQEKERELAELKKKELEKKELEKKLAEKKELEKKAEEKKLADAKAAAEKKKLAAEKAAKAKAEAAEQAKLDKLREDELKRMMGAAGGSGSAQKSTAPKVDAGYQAAIAAKVRSNTSFTGNTDVPGNPKAVFKVEQLPTGEILSVRLTKSSGVPQFDDAVERGINKSSPLPKKKDGTVERTIVVNFSMKDLD